MEYVIEWIRFCKGGGPAWSGKGVTWAEGRMQGRVGSSHLALSLKVKQKETELWTYGFRLMGT